MSKLAVICLVVPILVLLAYACERMWCANKKINAASDEVFRNKE